MRRLSFTAVSWSVRMPFCSFKVSTSTLELVGIADLVNGLSRPAEASAAAVAVSSAFWLIPVTSLISAK